MKKRKGSRYLDIGTERWSYFVGKRFVEIRSPDNKATLVRREVLDTLISSADDDWEFRQVEITLPGKVAQYIRNNLQRVA